MTTRDHSCIRCGLPVYELGAACTDCRSTDLTIIRAWTRKKVMT